MGRAIRACLAEFPDLELTVCVAPGRDERGPGSCSWMTPDQLPAKGGELPGDLVVIDVSLATGTARLLDWLERTPRPLVSATTGLGEAECMFVCVSYACVLVCVCRSSKKISTVQS